MVGINTVKTYKKSKVILEKKNEKPFGICIVRGKVENHKNTKTPGIFVKAIVPNSPADACGKLQVGDQIVSLNGQNIADSSEIAVIDIIKNAGQKLDVEIQTFEKPTSPINGIENSNYVVQAKLNISDHDNMKDISTTQQKMHYNFHSDEEEEEDSRDMTGRTRTLAGIEIDRSSAGNYRLSNKEQERNSEKEDKYGYTKVKISRRYNYLQDVQKIEANYSEHGFVGIAIAGHKDRQKMACFIVGIHPNSDLLQYDLKAGDEILEVNGTVLQNRCHLNAAVIFRKTFEATMVLITSRKKPIDEFVSVKPLHKYPVFIDYTEQIFTQFPSARSIQIKKDGCLGVMIIYGKHTEVGRGIFISDLREDAYAIKAGVQIGDMVLAVNKDATIQCTYEEVASLLRHAEGTVTLIVMTMKSDDTTSLLNKTEQTEPPVSTDATGKSQDPLTAVILPNKKTSLQIAVEKQPLGVIVVGGKNNRVKTGCVLTHIYPEGAIATDNRLKMLDHILEINNQPIDCKTLTTLKIHQMFNTPYEKIVSFQVFRPDPPEVEYLSFDLLKKSGKELGLSLVPNEKGCTISEIVSCGCIGVESKLQRGDIITKIDNKTLDGCSFEECYSIFKAVNGKVLIEIIRPNPVNRTDVNATS